MTCGREIPHLDYDVMKDGGDLGSHIRMKFNAMNGGELIANSI